MKRLREILGVFCSFSFFFFSSYITLHCPFFNFPLVNAICGSAVLGNMCGRSLIWSLAIALAIAVAIAIAFNIIMITMMIIKTIRMC